MSGPEKKKKYTPDLDHITSYEAIYEPAQDSYFLMDVLEDEVARIKQTGPLDVVVEVGPGSGVVSGFLHWLVREYGLAVSPPQVLGVDINIEACRVTRQTYDCNSVRPSDVVRSDLFSAFRRGGAGFIDLVVFNPPYVPSTLEEVTQDTGFTAAWAGGPLGRVVVDRFLDEVVPLLTPGTGTVYLLLISFNEPESVVEDMRERGLAAEVVADRRYGEHAFIVRIQRML